ncbi:ImmA/IrrE family metallo-endopeptidase [Sporosarcina sp. FSL K6-1522]|uniref:ImmA/IrrE family metallo-endopeptidase n=1 Tax=Sporosarcina sp. FSL K6-1522 TaxID=2921554 RepID=UPI00315A6DC4
MTWIKAVVENLTRQYGTNDPFKLASLLNIHIVYWDLHHEIQGFYKYDRRNKYIVINSNLSSWKQLYVLAHELGHSMMHPRVNTPFLREKTFLSVDRIEVEANTFAVELLLPDEALHEYKDSSLSISEVAGIHGVPEEVAHLKNLRNIE